MRWLVACATLVAVLAAAGPASAAAFFESPSGNVRCVIDRTSIARCDITRRDWAPPPRPRSCELDWANGLAVGFRGRGRFTCAGDAVPGGRALARGDAIRRGRFRCASRRDGIRCVNLRTDHGFLLGRERVRRF